MEIDDLLKLIESLKSNNEQPDLEVKDSLFDKEQIGRTFSAISNSASLYNHEYGHIIWGIENETWNIIGTKFNLETAKVGTSGFVYPQITSAFNYYPEILLKEFIVDDKRLYVARIKNAQNKPLSFKKISYIRIGEVNCELDKYPTHLKNILNKHNDWSSEAPTGSELSWIDPDAFEYLKSKYLAIAGNEEKKPDQIQLLNTLSLLDKNNKPNNTCLLFIGDPDKIKSLFQDRNKISWVYRDELNNIEERLSVEEENKPFIFSIENILNKVNKFNTTLQDIDLFRNDVSQYDKKAVEEMIINAIAHRDWNQNLWVEIIQTPTSLEIRNPGIFRADLKKVLLENKRPEYLNPAMTDFLKKIHLMEKEGGGLKKSYVTQIKKGLSIILKYDNAEVQNPRVDFTLSGKVSNITFARFMFTSSDLTQDQVVILDRINSGKNIFNKDISNDEYKLVENLVTKTGRGGVSLKIKEHLLKKSKSYINSFSSTHASSDTSKEIIMDYAKKNSEFTTAEVYDILSGKTKEWVRSCLMEMIRSGYLFRVKKGIYGLVKTIQTKAKNN